MKRIYLNAGHSNTDPGTSTVIKSVSESDLTKELRDLTADYLKYYYPNVEYYLDNDDDNLVTVINKINETVTKEDIVIDIHFNAFNSKASGVEVFIPKISSNIEKSIGNIICKNFSDIMDIPNRGIKTSESSARGRLGILKGTGNRILIEVCFADNVKDYDSYQINKYILASNLAEIIAE